MTILKASKLHFEFSSQWIVCEYDNDPNGFYRQTVQKCQEIGAVDFIATNGNLMLWIEVTNFRSYHTEFRSRLLAQEPAEVVECRQQCSDKHDVKIIRSKAWIINEVVKKVCGTFFGLALARREDDATLKPHIEALDRKLPIIIVLFLHLDAQLEAVQNFESMAWRFKTQLEQQLRFLRVSVQVENSFTLPENAGWKLKE
ncbi:MAG TPA: hypothetical protein EYP59_06345 [Thiotrichaceae bacterium]|nr:hypothetical protein [Thiotrichaceae bacterium]